MTRASGSFKIDLLILSPVIAVDKVSASSAKAHGDPTFITLRGRETYRVEFRGLMSQLTSPSGHHTAVQLAVERQV